MGVAGMSATASSSGTIGASPASPSTIRHSLTRGHCSSACRATSLRDLEVTSTCDSLFCRM